MDKDAVNAVSQIEKIEKTSELGYLLLSVLCGALMAVAYDFLRAKRREKKVPALIVYIEDTLWFIALGVMLYFLAFRANSGMVRWYSFAGAFIGAIVYKLIFGDKVMRLLQKLYGLFVRGLLAIIKLIVWPINLVLGAMRRPIRVVAWHTGESSRLISTYVKIYMARIKNRMRVGGSRRKFDRGKRGTQNREQKN